MLIMELRIISNKHHLHPSLYMKKKIVPGSHIPKELYILQQSVNRKKSHIRIWKVLLNESSPRNVCLMLYLMSDTCSVILFHNVSAYCVYIPCKTKIQSTILHRKYHPNNSHLFYETVNNQIICRRYRI